MDVWGSVKKEESISLWCDRARVRSKRKADDSESNSYSDDSSDIDICSQKQEKHKKKQKLSAMEERNERIENNIFAWKAWWQIYNDSVSRVVSHQQWKT